MSSSKAVSKNWGGIDGLSPKAREWLAETFDVHTFAALAGLSEGELINRMKADNKTAWIQYATDWPTEAAIKAAEMEPSTEAKQPIPAFGRQNNDTALTAASPEPSSRKPNSPGRRGKDGWDTLAVYVIEFQSRQVPDKPVERQTTVSFQGPGREKPPEPVEPDRICDWITEHSDGILPAMPETETQPDAKRETVPQESGPSPASISRLRLFQPSNARSPLFSYSSDLPQLSTVAADQPFDLEAILEVSRPRTSANGLPAFSVKFLVKNWDSNTYTILDDAEPETMEDQMAYSALLSGISLPRGKYRLQVLVLAHPKPVVLGSMEIPLLSVW